MVWLYLLNSIDFQYYLLKAAVQVEFCTRTSFLFFQSLPKRFSCHYNLLSATFVGCWGLFEMSSSTLTIFSYNDLWLFNISLSYMVHSSMFFKFWIFVLLLWLISHSGKKFSQWNFFVRCSKSVFFCKLLATLCLSSAAWQPTIQTQLF